MNIKEIVEGMTAPQVAQVIKDNFNEVDKDKANKTDLNKSISDLESVVEVNKTDLTEKIDNNKDETDAKLSGLGSEVNANKKMLSIKYNSLGLENAVSSIYYLNSDKTWIVSPAVKTYFIPINKGEGIKITANGDYNAYVAFTDEIGGLVIGDRISISKSDTIFITSPEDCYLYVVYKNGVDSLENDKIYYPSFIGIATSERLSNIESSIESNRERLDNIESSGEKLIIETLGALCLEKEHESNHYLSLSGNWMQGGYLLSYYFRLNAGDRVAVTANGENNSVIAFIKGLEGSDVVDGTSVESVPMGETKTFETVVDCYLYVSVWDGKDKHTLPSSIKLIDNKRIDNIETKLEDLKSYEGMIARPTTLGKKQIKIEGKIFLIDKTLIASTALVGMPISSVETGKLAGNRVYKLKLPQSKCRVTYSVVKSTSESGCIVTDKNDNVLWSYYEKFEETGTLKTVDFEEEAEWFYLNISPTLEDMEYIFQIEVVHEIEALVPFTDSIEHVLDKNKLKARYLYKENLLVKGNIGEKPEFANATGGAKIYKIPVCYGDKITYPVFKSSEGYGSIVVDESGVIVASYINETEEKGTYNTVQMPKGSAFFIFSASGSIDELDYEVRRKTLAVLEKLSEERKDERKADIMWLPFKPSLTNEKKSLCLAAIRFDIEDGKLPFQSGYVFHNMPDDQKLYFGTTLENAEELATVDYSPANCVMALSPSGCVIAVARDIRGTIRVWNGENHTVNALSSDGNEAKPLGWLYNAGVEFIIGQDGKEYCLFAEYKGTFSKGEKLYVWKGAYPYTSPSDWKTTFSAMTDHDDTYTTAQGGSVTHFHMVRRDPWTNVLYLSSGDLPGQLQWWYSKDEGESWNLLASDGWDSGTDVGYEEHCLRTINFIFTKEWVYWATDHGTNHTLNKVKRGEDGVIDPYTRVKLADLPEGQATNSLCYVENPEGLFMFERIDVGYEEHYSDPIKVLFWSFQDKKLKTLTELKQLTSNWGGHRGKCYTNYTNGSEPRVAMGFADNTRCPFDFIGSNENIGTIFYNIR